MRLKYTAISMRLATLDVCLLHALCFTLYVVQKSTHMWWLYTALFLILNFYICIKIRKDNENNGNFVCLVDFSLFHEFADSVIVYVKQQMFAC